jgi:hypothetical protein
MQSLPGKRRRMKDVRYANEIIFVLWELRFSQQWQWILLSSGIRCQVVWEISASVVEEPVPFLFRIEECYPKGGTSTFLKNIGSSVPNYIITSCHILENSNLQSSYCCHSNVRGWSKKKEIEGQSDKYSLYRTSEKHVLCMKSMVVWDILACSLVGVHRLLEEHNASIFRDNNKPCRQALSRDSSSTDFYQTP